MTIPISVACLVFCFKPLSSPNSSVLTVISFPTSCESTFLWVACGMSTSGLYVGHVCSIRWVIHLRRSCGASIVSLLSSIFSLMFMKLSLDIPFTWWNRKKL